MNTILFILPIKILLFTWGGLDNCCLSKMTWSRDWLSIKIVLLWIQKLVTENRLSKNTHISAQYTGLIFYRGGVQIQYSTIHKEANILVYTHLIMIGAPCGWSGRIEDGSFVLEGKDEDLVNPLVKNGRTWKNGMNLLYLLKIAIPKPLLQSFNKVAIMVFVD